MVLMAETCSSLCTFKIKDAWSMLSLFCTFWWRGTLLPFQPRSSLRTFSSGRQNFLKWNSVCRCAFEYYRKFMFIISDSEGFFNKTSFIRISLSTYGYAHDSFRPYVKYAQDTFRYYTYFVIYIQVSEVASYHEVSQLQRMYYAIWQSL
jgi:hypothetical protein